MRALVFEGKRKVRFRTVSSPKPKYGEVILKIHSVGICGTDLHIYNGGAGIKHGTVIGHEFSGIIAELGKGVKGLKKGDKVIAEHVISCGTCPYCRMGKPNLCDRATILGLDKPGALAEFMAVPARLVYPIPHTLGFDEAALIEPLTIALYAINAAGTLLEKNVAVIGQGPIGLLLDQVLTGAGAIVTGIDTQPNRLIFAKKKRWVRNALNAQSHSFAKQLKKISPAGMDDTFEAVGKEVTAEMALEIARKDGNIYLLGVFEQPSKLNLMQLVKKELNVFGSWTCAFSFPAAIDLAARHKVDLKSLITHRYAFSDAPKAFADAFTYAGNRRKTIIHVTE